MTANGSALERYRARNPEAKLIASREQQFQDKSETLSLAVASSEDEDEESQGVQAGSSEPAPAPAPFVSRYARPPGSPMQLGDVIRAAAGGKVGGMDGVLKKSRASHLARASGIVKSGFLLLQSDDSDSAWKRYFFAITGGESPKIDYFDNQQQYRSRQTPRASLPLAGAKAEMEAVDGKSTSLPKAFAVRCAAREMHVKVCDTWEDPMEWCALITALAEPAAEATPRKASGGSLLKKLSSAQAAASLPRLPPQASAFASVVTAAAAPVVPKTPTGGATGGGAVAPAGLAGAIGAGLAGLKPSPRGIRPPAATAAAPFSAPATALAPTPTPAPAPAPAAVPADAEYVLLKSSVIRAGFEMDSKKAGKLSKKARITVLERRRNVDGVIRIRFADGWTSEQLKDGSVVMELVAGGAAPQLQQGPPPQLVEPKAAATAAPVVPPKPPPKPTVVVAAAAVPANAAETKYTLVKPADGTGLGMNIDSDGKIIGFTGPGSVAEVAGIQVGTRIVQVNGSRVENRQQLLPVVKATPPGGTMDFCTLQLPGAPGGGVAAAAGGGGGLVGAIGAGLAELKRSPAPRQAGGNVAGPPEPELAATISEGLSGLKSPAGKKHNLW